MRGDRIAAIILLGGLLSGTTRARATLTAPSPGVNAPASFASAAPSLAVVSEDPYTNATSYHRTEVEPDSFAFGSTIVATFQAGRFEDRGASNLGWSVSTDAGGTWTGGFLPGTTIRANPPGSWRRVVDPAVAYDAMHDTWLIIGLGARSLRPTKSDHPLHYTVFVSRSTDGARSFGEPVIVRASHPLPTGTYPDRKTVTYFDKPWITCDNTPTSPYYGHCYAQWDDWGHNNWLWMSTSTDGGMTWTKARVPPYMCIIGGQPLVQPDGTVVMPISDCSYASAGAFISTDGGATYMGPFQIDARHASAVHGDLRDPPLPSADVDADGKVYLVWHDCRFRNVGPDDCTQNDIVMTTSGNGRHWSDVVRIPIDARRSSVDHFLPAIAVDPATAGASAHIALLYYFYPEADCNRAKCELSVGLVSSIDGGASWSVQQLAGPFRSTWFPLTTFGGGTGYMAGDYFSVSFVKGRAIAVFAAAADGACELGVTSCNVWTASATVAPPARRADAVFRAPGVGKSDNLDVFMLNIDGAGVQNVTNSFAWDGGPGLGAQP
jgi:hypothetical protein